MALFECIDFFLPIEIEKGANEKVMQRVGWGVSGLNSLPDAHVHEYTGEGSHDEIQ